KPGAHPRYERHDLALPGHRPQTADIQGAGLGHALDRGRRTCAGQSDLGLELGNSKSETPDRKYAFWLSDFGFEISDFLSCLLLRAKRNSAIISFRRCWK